FRSTDIFIDRGGVWHVGGIRREPDKALRDVDVVFNALHGEWGEDGGVQEVLEQFAVPYTGSRVLASRLAMNKALAKSFLAREGIKTPLHRVIEKIEKSVGGYDAHELFRSIPQPSVVKPLALGSSVGVSIAFDYFGFADALARAFEVSDTVLVEEYIKGREATCAVVDGFRGEERYALPPIEIVPPEDKQFFDYEAKYGGRTLEICPGNFSPEEREQLTHLASVAHRALGLRHYSRSDFILHPRRGIYFLEANTLPGLTTESLLPKAVAAVGSSLPEFLDHVLTLALEGK
ncbi:MAG: D-alanine-D-alanine ligase, partial [Parcubacteria group bacterium Gr01-1014_72]